MTQYLERFAESFGVTGMKFSKRMPNTRKALAVAEYAVEHGQLDVFRSLMMDAHWKDSRDIEDGAVLSEIAARSGLSGQGALDAASDPTYIKRVLDIRSEYKAVGTGGIPTFVFGTAAVEGCQRYEVLAEAARQAGAEPR